MSCRVLVTGAAGFIGSHTVDQLLAGGHVVCGVDDFRTGLRENLAQALANDHFTLEQLDITREPEFNALVRRVHPDAIIHLAALVSVPESIAQPALNEQLNLQATRIVTAAAQVHQVPRIVFASSAAVYGDPAEGIIAEDAPKRPLSPYGTAKLASESLLLESAQRCGFVARCQRYFNVYGPRQDAASPYSGVISLFVDRLDRRIAPVIYGDGEQTRDFIFVTDVARANIIAATCPGLPSGVANICTGHATSINALWNTLTGIRQVTLAAQHAPARPGDIRQSYGRPDQAKAALGFAADIDLREGLCRLLSRR